MVAGVELIWDINGELKMTETCKWMGRAARNLGDMGAGIAGHEAMVCLEVTNDGSCYSEAAGHLYGAYLARMLASHGIQPCGPRDQRREQR